MRSILFAMVVLCMAKVGLYAEGKWVELFNGKNLEGWKVIGCVVEVKDGCMFIKDGNGVVRPEKVFKDYVFEVDWKALKADNWDSGFYFRCIDPEGNYPWPKMYQANLRKGMEGNVDELKGAKSTGLTKAGEWNHFKLTVVGTKAELEINGKPAWKADGLKAAEGFISVQAEVPGGGQFLFKNIRVMELEGK
ncbi:MAG: DUF1080 domain-containing protein [Planctomycetota bacterium]|nr:DUF1080 domain-containing protein [Planctomycetota bacterium]